MTIVIPSAARDLGVEPRGIAPSGSTHFICRVARAGILACGLALRMPTGMNTFRLQRRPRPCPRPRPPRHDPPPPRPGPPEAHRQVPRPQLPPHRRGGGRDPQADCLPLAPTDTR